MLKIEKGDAVLGNQPSI